MGAIQPTPALAPKHLDGSTPSAGIQRQRARLHTIIRRVPAQEPGARAGPVDAAARGMEDAVIAMSWLGCAILFIPRRIPIRIPLVHRLPAEGFLRGAGAALFPGWQVAAAGD